ncbi:putative NADPH-quinone reductase [Inhella inkyongensis]|uniref:Putative NADPH-quinone reductase n=1 Tax=Inhella inkyongensis TaxID=392593 RepID=A0A840SAD5_9BURK|nr:NAD(P)H-dependent oxidoreductase [Inhella inkyongensis]MBB5205359.1 putative NADPH-quinone reductase [Inhella inkyongensis]
MNPVDPSHNFLFVLGSGRRDGNSEQLARRAAAAALPATQTVQWLSLLDHPLPRFEDRRHQPGAVFGPPEGHEAHLLEQTLAAQHIVFVAPVYWYSLPADLKRYLDYWSPWLRVTGADFKARMAGKTLSLITTLSDEDPAFAEPLVQTLKLTADYLGMHFGGAVAAYANRPGDVFAQPESLERATALLASLAALNAPKQQAA